MRTRPYYVPANHEWPPKWVFEKGRLGPMNINKQQFCKFIAILYILGVKGLGGTNINDMFSYDPYLREEWLCQTTTRHDLQRFLRQVSPSAFFPHPVGECNLLDISSPFGCM